MFLPLIQIWNNQFFSCKFHNSYCCCINSPKRSNNIISFPVYVAESYNDLHLSSIQEQIKNELKDLMGVYAFQHNASESMYIGSSASLHLRINNHFKNYSSNVHLQRAFNKYGLDNFTLHILEFYTFNSNLSKEENGKLLIQLEQQNSGLS